MATLKEAVAKIKQEYDIVDYIKSTSLTLTPSGIGVYKGVCPFHNEKTPSFTVNEHYQNYKCFGCGASGDIISYAQHVHSTPFIETVKFLGEPKGITLDDNIAKEASFDLNSIMRVVKDTADFFNYNFRQLNENHPAKLEIKKRGLDINSEIYGYAPEAPNDLYKFLKAKGHKDEAIKQSNLVVFFDDNREPWDFFHKRLTITLSDIMGRPISFTSRKLFEDDKMPGKYVNGKDSPVFHKKTVLFGAHVAKRLAKESSEIIITEGQFDVLALHSIGLENTVATSGTAFTDEHTGALRKLVGPRGRIVFVFDGDNPGIKAAISVFKSQQALHTQAYAVALEEGSDPCDYVQNGRGDEIKKLISTAPPIYDFIVDQIFKQNGSGATKADRMQFAKEIAMLSKECQDKMVVSSLLSRASIMSAISVEAIESFAREMTSVTPRKLETEKEENTINPMVQIDTEHEGDMAFLAAISLFVLSDRKSVV